MKFRLAGENISTESRSSPLSSHLQWPLGFDQGHGGHYRGNSQRRHLTHMPRAARQPGVVGKAIFLVAICLTGEDP
ncbi:hypothetical protein CYMTET_17022 [Cymbomonas tetramitiformis]|uniref:Uncharacterized protein n=1 Tax=Cymbomonas tetramitiformis TaxID=36881 RepID=A0AAE0GB75_9CHLO|nr:hypothetical protein CYMTET_17022 [Cymbomonas tetramitiformis]